MEPRKVGIVGAFDYRGVYGIGSHLPWSGENGRSMLRLDMGRFVLITRDVRPAPELQNVTVMGSRTMDTFGWRTLPNRHTIVLSQTVSEEAALAKTRGAPVAIARNVEQALERALSFDDCGNVFFVGGYDVWLQALKSGFCNCAFTTVIDCDSVEESLHHDGPIRRAPEMVRHETFGEMVCEEIPIEDSWGEKPVNIRFRNYHKCD